MPTADGVAKRGALPDISDPDEGLEPTRVAPPTPETLAPLPLPQSLVEDEEGPDTKRSGVGAILAGKYRIEREIARGGMGVVYEAVHLQLQDRVAIKVLRHEAMMQRSTVARFLQEARATARLRSEHVTRVFDIGTDPDAAPYIVMEYLEGAPLSELMETRGKLPYREAVDIVLQVLDGLAAAHAVGIVHRDIKPANLVISARANGAPFVKIVDFGISKVLRPASEDESALTNAALLLGTPSFMAPEQLVDPSTVDARADIWSVGAVLYTAMTGEEVFRTTSLADLLRQATSTPTPPRRHEPSIPEPLESIVLRCLAQEPTQRFQTALALADALAPFATPLRGSAPSLPSSGASLLVAAAPAGQSETILVPPVAAAPPPPAPAAVPPVAGATVRLSTAMLQEVTRHHAEERQRAEGMRAAREQPKRLLAVPALIGGGVLLFIVVLVLLLAALLPALRR